jgi:transcriptional regulator with XRE-family HTH domain
LDYTTIGKNLRTYRKQRNLTQEQLAERAGLSPNYIGILERGEKLPSLETLLTLLNQLNVSADMVLCDVLNTGYAIKGSQLSEQLAGCDKKVQDRVLAVVATLLRNP